MNCLQILASWRLPAAAAVVPGAFGAVQPAIAAAGLYQTVNAAGTYFSNSASLQGYDPEDGSSYNFVVCVSPESPMQPCLDALPPNPSNGWEQLPNLPSSASAQAFTPDYGINRVRTWSTGTQAFDDHPGLAYYSAAANSGWRDEITTTSAAPVIITFVVSLHVDWNDGGLWAFQMGRPGAYDPDTGFAEMDGHTWANCLVEAQSGQCRFDYYTGNALTVLPGGANGGVDFFVTQQFTVYPGSIGDPESPQAYSNPFEAVLGARSGANDAEVLGYSTASLQGILVPPDAGLTFASGHAYNVQVVPEPATWVLWATGLLAVARLRTRVRRSGGDA